MRKRELNSMEELIQLKRLRVKVTERGRLKKGGSRNISSSS
jgi:hypothetical protein